MMESHESLESNYEYTGLRKGRKLLAEKRRRMRINHSLQHIKNIVCATNMKKDPNWNKMEKAEILETTVDYLRNVRKITRTQQETKEIIQARFHQGFSKCAEEMLSYIRALPGVSNNVHWQLRKHFGLRLSQVHQLPVTSAPQSVTPPIYDPAKLPFSEISYQRLTARHRQYIHAHADETKESTSLSDSGYCGSPKRLRQTVPEEARHSINVYESELPQIETRISCNNSRVMEWLQNSLQYSKSAQLRPWRPW